MNIQIPDTEAGHLAASAIHIYQAAINEQDRTEILLRPSYILRPCLSLDGNQWCALYGDSLQDGVAGFGCSPELAYKEFDKEWVKSLLKKGDPQ